MVRVAALYIDRLGPYPGMTGVDAWDIERDARLYEGPHPIVAHPPCGPWGRLRFQCTKQDPDLAPRAVEQLARWGGVLEHPAHSLLWQHCGLPRPDELDFSGRGLRTLDVEQVHWGHQARKRTWLLCCRVETPEMPPATGSPTHHVSGNRRTSNLPILNAERRRRTPIRFAMWLVDLAATRSRHD